MDLVMSDIKQVQGFWDNHFTQMGKEQNRRVVLPEENNPVLLRALQHFGNVKDKILIDLGCGRGPASLFFASHGAQVISIDFSEVAIENLNTFCRDNSFNNIEPIRMSAQEISTLDQVDFVFGSMILHHIEPFDKFAETLRAVIKPGGKGFFWENSSRSKILIWFRNYLVGKLWLPKYGDSDEFPFTLNEIDELKNFFHVDIEYPILFFFELFSKYFLRGHARQPFQMLDKFFYGFPAFRKYSYRQYICLNG